MDSSQVGAVIVSYNPPSGLTGRLARVAAMVGRAVLVDNGSAELPARPGGPLEDSAWDAIQYPSNLGIAAALNTGVDRLAQAGFRWVLLLDHDSTPTPGMMQRLLAAAGHPSARSAAALVPRVEYAHPGIRCRWPHTAPGSRFAFSFVYADALREPCAIDFAISSGMLLNVEAWRRIGPFREDLFIDLVDTEYCLRSRRAGWTIVAVPGAVLEHALGRVEQRRLPGLPPMYPTHHVPVRHYYLARNRVLLARDYARRFPSWFIFELSSAAKLLIKSLLFETGRWSKLRATLLGTWDGLLGRTGPCPRNV